MFTIQEYPAADGKALRYGLLTDPNRETPAERAMLYVPGLGGSVKGALGFLENLLPVFDPIYGPDLRGFGINSEERLPHPDYFLEDLRAFQKHVGLDQSEKPVTLCGISLGGTIATKFSVKYANDFHSLILVAPAYAPSAVSFPASYVLKNLWGRVFGGINFETRMPYTLRDLTRNPAVLNDPAASLEPLALSGDFLLKVSLFNRVAQHWARRISLPTLVIIPGRDVVCCPRGMRTGYRRIPASVSKALREYPECFHDILMEPEAGQVAADVIAWLETLKPVPTGSDAPWTSRTGPRTAV